MNKLVKFIFSNPVSILIWSSFVEGLVAFGYIPETYKDKWMTDGGFLIAFAGLTIFLAINFHHKADLHKQQVLAGATVENGTEETLAFIKTLFSKLLIPKTPNTSQVKTEPTP